MCRWYLPDRRIERNWHISLSPPFIPHPLPPLATQQAIVAEIEAEQTQVAANRELIARFEKKIQTTLARVWGENTLEPFGESA